jgi:hypothetical protein
VGAEARRGAAVGADRVHARVPERRASAKPSIRDRTAASRRHA